MNAGKHPAVIVFFLGVVSHWVSVVCHRHNGTQSVYLLDSTNHVHLDRPITQVPALILENNRKDELLGIKHKKFGT
jgi:hypothetical protein